MEIIPPGDGRHVKNVLVILSLEKDLSIQIISKNLLTPIPGALSDKLPLVLNSQLARHHQVRIERAICINSED
jgi:hypothetical protein